MFSDKGKYSGGNGN